MPYVPWKRLRRQNHSFHVRHDADANRMPYLPRRRHGHKELLLDFPTAALGGEVTVPTIDGTKVKIKIEPGTQPGKTLRLRGKGLPAVKGYGSGVGDEVVNISVFVPKKLSSKERKAIEELRESENFQGDTTTKKSIFEKFKNYFN